MNKKLERILNKLKEKNYFVSTMESCSGGGIANEITNIPGASEVFKFGAVTYSNEYKIKMGVCEDIIKKHSVYSRQTADEMSLKISMYANADFGIGITGKLLKSDKFNDFGKDNIVFISVFSAREQKYYNDQVTVIYNTREKNKKMIIKKVITLLEKAIAGV